MLLNELWTKERKRRVTNMLVREQGKRETVECYRNPIFRGSIARYKCCCEVIMNGPVGFTDCEDMVILCDIVQAAPTR